MKDSNLLIKKLTNKAEFVDRCTWVLGSENGRNAFASCNSIGDFKKALSANYSCYYISPDVFSGDFRFENVLFEGKPKGLSVDVEFRLQLFPETLGFADWVKENVSFELSKEAFVEKIRAPKYGLKDFLQEWFVFAHDDKLDFGLLQKYGKGALREYVGQSRYIDPWLHIDGMQWIKVDDIPARERESLEKFNEIQRKHADELRALREKTAFEVSKISIEEALAIAQSNQRLAEVSRQLEIKRLESDIAKANAEKAEAELRELQAKKAKEGLTNQQSERLISLQEGITQYYKELKWRDSRIEELESLIDSLKRELAELRKKFSDKDWYDELSAWGKVLRHVRSITAMLFYIAGFYCILAGCKYSKLDASGKVLFSHLSSIGQWFAFVEAAIFWLTAFILNGQTVKKSFNEIKYWWIELFKGKIKVNLPLLVCGFLRIFAASYLMVIGAFAVIWIPYLFIWGFLYEFQKEFFTGVIVICMAASGLGLGSYTLGARLLMKRRIRATSKSGRKWVMIIFIPLLFIAFYDKRAARRVDNLEVKISEMFLSKKERDIRKAIKAYDNKDYATWWTLVANLDQGDRRIVERLGHSYFLGLGIKSPDYRKAVEQFEKLLEKVGSDGEGYASVEYLIGLCYHRLSEYNTAIGYFKNAIEDGEFNALLYAGQYYEFGLGVRELDLKEAAKYFERALKSKNETVREKAEEYLKRVRNKIDQLNKLLSVPKNDVRKNNTDAAIQAYNQRDYKNFWKYVEKADENNLAIVVFSGQAYGNGQGVATNYLKAIEKYEKAKSIVNDDKSRSMFDCAIAFYYNDLLNYDKAAEYAKLAVDNGNIDAWLVIAICFEDGKAGRKIDLNEALRCYEKSLTSSNATVKKLAQDGASRVKAKIKAMKSIDKDIKKIQLWEGGPYWADRNIGAEKPEDYGYYFWWGDTIGYKRDGDKWVASDGSSSNFSFEEKNVPTCDKSYSTLQSEGKITADGVLAPECDAAHQHWGGGWRMPTKSEYEDLLNSCDWKWVTKNDINGYVVCGRGNYSSASIFLPCAGCASGPLAFGAESNGYYWSSVALENGSYGLFFYPSRFDYSVGYRFLGASVRPLQGCHQTADGTENQKQNGGVLTNKRLSDSFKPIR